MSAGSMKQAIHVIANNRKLLKNISQKYFVKFKTKGLGAFNKVHLPTERLIAAERNHRMAMRREWTIIAAILVVASILTIVFAS